MMRILVTGAKGFVGKNLCAALRAIRDGQDRSSHLQIGQVFECDRDTPPQLLDSFCAQSDFVFHLAGVNRSGDDAAFMAGNRDFSARLLQSLNAQDNRCPVMLASSVQATLEGRYDSEYGRSKRAAEELFFAYGQQTGARVLVYRFPNLFGKWCRPNYNSVVATFCHNLAHDLPISIHDPQTRLEMLYIDDLVAEMLLALEGREHRWGAFCYAPNTHTVTLGEIAALLQQFKAQPQTLVMPQIPAGSFGKKLYSTYLSYLPKEKVAFPLQMHADDRGSFTELLKTEHCGQFSVNIAKPGITKGEHWHHSKWEFFIVVAGHGLIRMRKVGTEEVLEFPVSGDHIQAVHMLPGYTHSIVNLSETENLVTVMWANEPFDPHRPDTCFEKVN